MNNSCRKRRVRRVKTNIHLGPASFACFTHVMTRKLLKKPMGKVSILISWIRKPRLKMVEQISQDPAANTWKSQVQAEAWLTLSPSVCVLFPIHSPRLSALRMWGFGWGMCWHYTGIERHMGKNTSHALTIHMDFMYPLGAPKSELPPLF